MLLYGMGNGAEKILTLCGQYGVTIRDIFASDEFVRGHSFAGHRVLRYEEVEKKYKDAVILLAFAAFQPELLARIYRIAERYEVLAPDVPLFGTDIFDRTCLHRFQKELEQAWRGLADQQSQQVFSSLVEYKLSGSIRLLKQMETPRNEVFSHILPLGPDEIYVDLGAYNGDTLEEFLAVTGGRYSQIIAVEPDKKNFIKLEEKAQKLGTDNLFLYPCGVWKEDTSLLFAGKGGRNSSIDPKGKPIPVRSVDSILSGSPATYIKMDVEGAEHEVLQGCRDTLRHFAPKLAVSAYHRTFDFFTLPLLLRQLQPDYRIYLRHHPYIPAWETNLYAVAP